MTSTLAIVLARAGSKGLPGKNALLVAGRPMLAWTLEHALTSHEVDAVVLSTDGPALAQVAQAMAVPVLERPAELAGDTASVAGAARDALRRYEAEHGLELQRVAILYGNVPVRPADLTDRALRKLRETGADSVQSVYRVGKTHPLWMRTLGGTQGDELGMYQPNTIHRRQDLPPVYMLDGGVIAVTRAGLLQEEPDQPHAFLGIDRRAVVTEEGEVIDVDSRLDHRVAEAVLLERLQAPTHSA